MLELADYDKCTGCMACFNACQVGAIRMDSDELGMLRPTIDTNICVNCGGCIRSCPAIDPFEGREPIEAWATYTKNEHYREVCSSGGVASTLGASVINRGGIVFGAGFDGEKCVYKRADTLDALEELKGSKYVFCDPQKIYREIKTFLQKGFLCLFIGTPCHVDALNHYLNKPYENLICIDLICHGTPPYIYLQQHISHNKKREIKCVTFRENGIFKLQMIDCQGNTVYSVPQDEEPYYFSFLNGLIHREICYHCRYATNRRCSDITIGDFWGLGKDALGGYNGRVSVVLPNSEKGKAFFDSNAAMFERERREVDEAVRGNEQLSHPSKAHPQRACFIEAYQQTQNFDISVQRVGMRRQVIKNRIRNIAMFIPRKLKKRILR